ncbi:MAG: 4'-phosphopantetheinyl transferase superfamily protein [Proteobacteria bacterium]|nr:4'-phosphopantetheinyl transferase superfamily protein [Pseudomonadota bacterium]
MIDAHDFLPATPAEVVQPLDHAIHLWRMPWRREQGRALPLRVLAGYLHVDPSTLRLETGPHGKPFLPAACPLRFNWSHSGEFALLALAGDVEPGVDIELPREGVRALDLARRFFTPEESDALEQLPGHERESSFLQLWTAKEAVLKALGHGLAFGLERIGFALRQGTWHPVRFAAEAGAAADWQVLPLRIAGNYAGALAWRGPTRPVRAWAWAPGEE